MNINFSLRKEILDMMKVPFTQLNYQNNLTSLNNKSTDQIKEDDKKEKVFETQIINLNGTKTKSYKYVLEGGLIKVYLVKDGVTMQCVKTISLKDVDPSILSQVENISFSDIIMILDMQKDEEKKHKKEKDIHDNKGYNNYSKQLSFKQDI